MTQSPTWLLVLVLGVWRVTHLLVAEDGPWDVVARVRAAAGHGVLGRMLDCFDCLSLWIALPFALAAGGLRGGVPLWLALSGGAMLVERVAARVAPPAVDWVEAPAKDDDGMLRK